MTHSHHPHRRAATRPPPPSRLSLRLAVGILVGSLVAGAVLLLRMAPP